MKLTRLFFSWLKLNLLGEMAYKWNFFLRSIMLVFFDLIAPLIALIIYSVSRGIPGWAFEEFLLLQGIVIFVFGVDAFMLTGISMRTIRSLITGVFDVIMIRPYAPLKFISTTSLDLEHISEIFTGLALITYAVIKLQLAFELNSVIMFLILVFLALAFIFSINLITAAIAFFVGRTTSLVHMLGRMGEEVAAYPLSIYNRVGVLLFSFVLPFGIVAFYPAEALLRGLDLSIFFKLVAVISVFLVIALMFWNYAIKHYTSAGG